ncbi:aspartyl-tRNA synthetase [Saprolegnia parasitica CBS 223.65]|uniref:Aspartyl-tRNA synthetase n=1 Tax=Saprolegnia parasitica (strain CBS 223.65) TaxID=695850 RepID=A0A067D1D8_SAPPC|nr:aspartyl-tRNA synthetase [Saprolegnia parasitica CBS 223.65]KDO32847.1 aspartyl-tRNA synthetase [Saprolegnia parasitica CBS 223.65]|eukprot:XP_012196501.1 aspartyl-tRNA synthetase [Saprolegnia parasitica CBS 223.65]
MASSSDATLATQDFRTHTCGGLREGDVGSSIKLSGWVDAVRAFGPLTFVSLRDRHGTTQLVFSDERVEAANQLKPESVIRVTGAVRERPDTMRNANMATGAIEVVVDSVETLNTCAQLPMQVSTGSDVATEETRLRHRYLDLRRASLQQNLAVRSKVAMTARNYLCDNGFLEIETPTLFKSTPEGAREFLVPTRTKNQFYALTQSPQQYKQLLMVGGLDRYFQLARCYRDEGGRADRQPEFTQIDLEMSFVNQHDIMGMIEGMVKQIWHGANASIDMSTPFPIMSFDEAMDRFGVDKPDTRYGLEMRDILAHMPKDVVGDAPVVRAINAKQLGLHGFSRKDIGELEALSKRLSVDGKGAFVVKVDEGQAWKSSLAKKLSNDQLAALNMQLEVDAGDVLLIASGSYASVCTLLGRMRIQCAQMLYAKGFLQKELDPFNYHHLWVVDFPMFELDEGGNGLSATHHPFTAPQAAHLPTLQALLSTGQNAWEDEAMQTALLNIKAQHFDLVCNGWELGGGSIRLHSVDLQNAVLQQVLNLPEVQKKSFEHLLNALGHGAPPHGGIALGLDRLVAILCGASSLRDVIAFPKSTTGNELMTGSPGPVTPEQLLEYHIAVNQATTTA